ncbi:MAG: type II secretion system protein [Chlamydia sp.]
MPPDSQKNRNRFSITLIEMIVVMILIATITGALAVNYRESLNEGKAFKTREGIARIEAIITIFIAESAPQDLSNISWNDVIRNSPLIKDPDAFLRDGWGKPYEINVSADNSGDTKISIHSAEYEKYKLKKGRK